MPVVLPPRLVEGPVGPLGVDEDHPGVGVLVIGVGPHVEVAIGAVRVGPGGLKPRVLVAGVVHDQIGDDPDAAFVSLLDEIDEVADGPELGQDRGEVGDVVAAVLERRGVDRQQPDAVDAEPLQVIEALGQAADIAGAVAVGVAEAADQDLVEDRALVPLRVPRRLEGERIGHRLGGGCPELLQGGIRSAARPSARPGPLPLSRYCSNLPWGPRSQGGHVCLTKSTGLRRVTGITAPRSGCARARWPDPAGRSLPPPS